MTDLLRKWTYELGRWGYYPVEASPHNLACAIELEQLGDRKVIYDVLSNGAVYGLREYVRLFAGSIRSGHACRAGAVRVRI